MSKAAPTIEAKPYEITRKYGEPRYAPNVNAVKALILGDLRDIGEKAMYYRDKLSLQYIDELRSVAHRACQDLWTSDGFTVEGIFDAGTGVQYSVTVKDRRRP